MKKNFWHIIAGAGAVIAVLGIILMALILKDDSAEIPEFTAPSAEFIYSPDEQYGNNLLFSTEVEENVFYDLSERARDEIIKRISAFFLANYHDYKTFGLAKNSYKKTETDAKSKVVAMLVSNIGTVVKLEIINTIENGYTTKTTIRILTLADEEAYKTEIKWEELDV